MAIRREIDARDTPSWVVGLLVISVYFCIWGVVLAAVGASSATPVSAARLLQVARWVLLTIAVAALLMTLLLALRRVRRRQTATAVATQMTSGAMLTVVVVSSALADSHAAAIRDAYKVLPAGLAAVGFTVVSVIDALVLFFLSPAIRAETGPAGERSGAEAALGLALVATLVTAGCAVFILGSLVARAPASGVSVWDAFQWGGDVAAALLLLAPLIAYGLWRTVRRGPPPIAAT